MRLGLNYDKIHAAGAELVAISVDDDVRQAGMGRRWALAHTRFVSDPAGERYLRRLGLFDPEERGGIALPGMLVITPGAEVVYRFEGRDFADRTNDPALFEALDRLDLPPVSPPEWASGVEVPDDLGGFFHPRDLWPYFRGNYFAGTAIYRRAKALDDDIGRRLANEHRFMAKDTFEAWQEWKHRIPEGYR